MIEELPDLRVLFKNRIKPFRCVFNDQREAARLGDDSALPCGHAARR